jgi:hypothetical protein
VRLLTSKDLKVLLIILTAITAAIIYEVVVPENDEFIVLTQRALANVESGNWNQANLTMDRIEEKWNHHERYLLFRYSAGTMQDFEETLAQTKEYVKARESGLACAHIARLREIWREFQG